MGNDSRADGAEQLQAQEAARKKKEGQEPLAPAVVAVGETQEARMAHAEAVAQQKEAAEARANQEKAAQISETPEVDAFTKDLQVLAQEFEIEEDDPKLLFYKVAEQLAQEVEELYGVPWQVCLAQACLESGYGVGMNEAGRKGFVVFGIQRGSSYEGPTVDSATKEEENGRLVDKQAKFRAHDSIRAAFMAYGKFLTNNFSEAFEVKEDPTAFLLALQADPNHRYATSSKYVETIQGFWSSKGISVESSVTGGESYLNSAMNWIFELAGEFKKAIAGFLSALGVDTKKWGLETKGEMAEPDAPFFSFSPDVQNYVTSAFGERRDPFDHSKMADHRHGGVDISAPKGAKIYATFSGTVTHSAADVVTVQRTDGVSVTMRHLDTRGVKKGATVKTGTVLGTVGTKGRSTGPHLHFETRKDGKLVDPLPYLSARLRTQGEAVATEQAGYVRAIRAGGNS